jgi:hypothetical protein
VSWLAVCQICWCRTPAPRCGINGETLCQRCFEQQEREWAELEQQSTVYEKDIEIELKGE